MEKRFVAFVVLSAAILIGWTFVSKKLSPKPVAAPVTASAPAPAPESAPPAPAPAAVPEPAAPTAATSSAVAAAAAEEFRVETETAAVLLTNAGARVKSWRLKGYESAGRPVDLVGGTAARADALPLSLVFDERGTLPDANRALYETERTTGADGSERVTFRWADGAGSSIEKTLVFRKSDPLVDLEVAVVDRGRTIVPKVLLGPGLEAEDEKSRSNTYYSGQAVLLDGGLVTRLAHRKIDETIIVPESPRLGWAGLEDQYFTALLLPAGSRGGVTIAPLQATALAPQGTQPEGVPELPTVAVSMPEGKAQIFVGPKSFGALQALGHDLQKVVWFSDYSLIYACAKPLFLALRWVHDHWVANYGMAIILLTIGLRVLLFPLNQYSMVKMRKVAGDMQRVQPKLKALQAKYKKSGDAEARAKLNTETMELYKREGVNPFGGVSGCLPLLMQMPILWAFFDVLTAAVELRGAPFLLWIQDLTHPDPFYLTPILMGATMFVQQKMTPTANMDPAQARMMLFMPLIFTVMFVTLPSGLVLYYFVNNLLGIGQQWLVNRHVARLEAAPTKA